MRKKLAFFSGARCITCALIAVLLVGLATTSVFAAETWEWGPWAQQAEDMAGRARTSNSTLRRATVAPGLYKVFVTLIATDLYQTEEGVSIQTANCHVNAVFHERAVFQWDGANGRLAFGPGWGNAVCLVQQVG